jgi:RND family efflux transporter MFP subunit
MKKLFTLALIAGFISCQNSTPDDLNGKKTYLKTKKAELQQIQTEIDLLSSEILELDPPKEKKAKAVKSIAINPQEFVRHVEIQGHVEAHDIANVSSEVGGRIVNLYVKEGDKVNRGQLVATTDLSTLENQIAEIESKLSLANTVFERQKRLWDQNIGSEIQYLQAKNNKDGLEKSLVTLKSQVKKKNIYAPITGVVDIKFLNAGETASPGMPIVQILNTDKIKIVANVQENFLKAIQLGDQIEVYFPSLDRTLMKKVDMIGRTIDPANRTFKIEINTNSEKGLYKPNLLAILKFVDYSEKEVLIIPLDAIQEEVNGQKFVYLAHEMEGKTIAKKSDIKIGESNLGECIVIEGMTAGANLITAGSKNIADGDIINIQS